MKVEYSDDKQRVEQVLEGLKAKDGFCPCKVGKKPENKCMCEEFRNQIKDENYYGPCHCGLYVKKKD